MLIPTLLERGEEWQKEQFIPKTVSGEYRWAQGYSEPGSGSDLASLRTRGELSGDEWVINGQKIAAGDRLCLLYASANRDESVFEDPDEIRLDRSPNPHVAFGLGTHFCQGANLARLTLRVFFEELTKRLDTLEATAPPEYEANVFIKGVRRFHVAFESA